MQPAHAGQQAAEAGAQAADGGVGPGALGAEQGRLAREDGVVAARGQLAELAVVYALRRPGVAVEADRRNDGGRHLRVGAVTKAHAAALGATLQAQSCLGASCSISNCQTHTDACIATAEHGSEGPGTNPASSGLLRAWAYVSPTGSGATPARRRRRRRSRRRRASSATSAGRAPQTPAPAR